MTISYVDSFNIAGAVGMEVTIDVSHAHFWDITAVAALDKVVTRFKANGISTKVIGANVASSTLIERLDRSATAQR